MSHFYGTLKGSKGEVTRCGTRNSGITTYAACWHGAIRTTVYQDNEGRDSYRVVMVPWQGAGDYREIAKGRFE